MAALCAIISTMEMGGERNNRTPGVARNGPLEDSHTRLLRNRAYAQSSREQGCDKLSILLNGITTSVSPMVLSQHPMDHAQERARGTNAKSGLGPRVRSVYQVAPVSSMVCRGSARIMCSEAEWQEEQSWTHARASGLARTTRRSASQHTGGSPDAEPTWR